MSWLDPPPDPFKILVHGYIREQKLASVPVDIKNLIYSFYPKKCTVYGIGANNYGELGVKGKLLKFQTLTEYNKLSIQPQDIFYGYSRFTVKTHQDRIYSIGNNFNGDCGCGKEPTQVTQLTEIDMTHVKRNKYHNFIQCVSSGLNHMLFVLNNIVYSTGKNDYGQCGNNTTDTIYIPITICDTLTSEHNRIIQIECGYNHTILLNQNGTLYGCGRNDHFQCGIQMDTKDNYTKTMQQIQCDVLFRNVSVGGYHNLCISQDNILYIFGNNESNQLGVYGIKQLTHYKIPTIQPYFGDRKKDIVFTSTKHEHSMAIDSKGICYLFGANFAYQISKIESNDVVIFQREYKEFSKAKMESGSCGYNHTLLLTLDKHKVIGFGGNQYRHTNPYNPNKTTKEPHTFNNMEIGINYGERIVRVIAGEFTSLLIQQ